MGKIEQLVKCKLLGNDNPSNLIWPITKTQAVYDKNDVDLQTVLDGIKAIIDNSVSNTELQETLNDYCTKLYTDTNFVPLNGVKTLGGQTLLGSGDVVKTINIEDKYLAFKCESGSVPPFTALIISKQGYAVVGYSVSPYIFDYGDIVTDFFWSSPAKSICVGIDDSDVQVFMITDGGLDEVKAVSQDTSVTTNFANYIQEGYKKPSTGIPESDLSAEVQTKLNGGVTPGNTMEIIEYGTNVYPEGSGQNVCHISASQLPNNFPDSGGHEDVVSTRPDLYLTLQDRSTADATARYSGLYTYVSDSELTSVIHTLVVWAINNSGDWSCEWYELGSSVIQD